MLSTSQVLKRLSKAMTRLSPNVVEVYLRLLSREGGDALLGVAATVTYDDRKLSPQPIVSTANDYKPFVLSSEAVVPATDYYVVCSAEAVTEDELKAADTLFVFKTPNSDKEELLFIAAYEPVALAGSTVMYKVLVRSKKQ